MSMMRPNSSNAQGGPSSLVVLVSSKLLQSVTGRSYLLLRRHHKKHSSKPNRTPRVRPRHSLLHVLLILLHHIQDMRIHYPSDCWLISCFFSAAHLLNMPMEVHNSKANHKVKPRVRYHRRRFSLLPPRHPRPLLLLLLLLLLPHQVQRPCSHDLFHCELASCCFFAVHLPRTPIIINIGTQLFFSSSVLVSLSSHHGDNGLFFCTAHSPSRSSFHNSIERSTLAQYTPTMNLFKSTKQIKKRPRFQFTGE
ncbi:uncharacterized protein BJ212DRAFT_810483 [Suillus subaureus]|uniref:Uncharacterized protein n=1 Tax=Suillus subaureus TaxID=48587 RepID=A0A9P7JGW3_9AGAM|nr:uncharacterized protein BJ212DRAFT_810483 [Suillus subaureus]KAG1822535.1 hypothetical protein BJ212DRAFT_810483 [Suillus subaureus]